MTAEAWNQQDILSRHVDVHLFEELETPAVVFYSCWNE